jgi:hypothetical protein
MPGKNTEILLQFFGKATLATHTRSQPDGDPALKPQLASTRLQSPITLEEGTRISGTANNNFMIARRQHTSSGRKEDLLNM